MNFDMIMYNGKMVKMQSFVRWLQTTSFFLQRYCRRFWNKVWHQRFDISNFEIDWPLPKGKNKKSSWSNERLIKKQKARKGVS